MAWTVKPPAGTPLDTGNPLYTGLIACVPFYEGSGAPAELIEATPTTPANLTWGTGDLGHSGVFNGLSTDVALSGIASIASEMTVLLKVKISNLMANQMLVEASPVNETWFVRTTSGGNILFNGKTGLALVNVPAADVGVTVDTWATLCVTIAPGSVGHVVGTLYVDGVQESTGDEQAVAAGPESNGTIHVGNYDNDGYWFGGEIEYVYLWNRALTLSEVGEISDAPYSLFLEEASGPTAGTASFVSSGPASIAITATDAAGGTSPYTYQWQRNEDGGSYSDLTDGGGVSGATTLDLVDGSAEAGTLYGYRLVYTDDDAATATSNVVTAQVYSGGSIGGGTGSSPFQSSLIRGV